MNHRYQASEIVENILSDFSSQEIFLQQQLQIIQSKRLDLIQGQYPWIPLKFDTREDVLRTKENALRRNKKLKRDLNISMGKLRSKQCYSPAADNLNKMIEKYSEILSKEDKD